MQFFKPEKNSAEQDRKAQLLAFVQKYESAAFDSSEPKPNGVPHDKRFDDGKQSGKRSFSLWCSGIDRPTSS